MQEDGAGAHKRITPTIMSETKFFTPPKEANGDRMATPQKKTTS
jgi:hypothetical protein